MRNGISPSNPFDDYDKGLISFDDLCEIIEATPCDDITPEEQEYYRELAIWAETAEPSPGGKVYVGKDARKRGRELLMEAWNTSNKRNENQE